MMGKIAAIFGFNKRGAMPLTQGIYDVVSLLRGGEAPHFAIISHPIIKPKLKLFTLSKSFQLIEFWSYKSFKYIYLCDFFN
ncbi:hypothetical protein ACLB1T_16110 [Escherichia coli]